MSYLSRHSGMPACFRFLSTTLNREAKVIAFCDCRLLPKFWNPGYLYLQWGTHKIGGLHKNDSVMAAKADEKHP